ncbi:hypothetical protein C9374_008390 [Naegleria lovaniensis]|uniref:Eukaryotic translation initiation factor 4E n=1 Tax=Naegleria lovaniensis TaxID=51637 RepID=A0AA88GF16_NAELO|nr:uncharacterized protein C9374_008390 [Naegleria lovaniensis]KAG2378247.1 hypothetical protein C9374_008390 [Naegleria lovaniensis]
MMTTDKKYEEPLADHQGEGENYNEDEESVEKHFLENSWTLWYHNPQAKLNEQNYSQFFSEVYTFSDVETFWSVFNHIRGPSDIATGTTYFLLKEGIKPAWEDPQCINGGEWVYSFPRKFNSADQYWLDLVMFCVGECFTYSENLLGCCVANRKNQIRINLWVNTLDETIAKKFGEQFKFEALKLNSSVSIDFKSFKDQLDGKKTILQSV